MIEQLDLFEVTEVEDPSEPEPSTFLSEIIENILVMVIDEVLPVIVSETAKCKPKIYSCNKCGKSFAQHLSSKKHMKSCRGFIKVSKSVICNICKKSFSENWSLRRHIGSVHANKEPREDYHCDECDIKFCSKQKMEHHNQRKHGHNPRSDVGSYSKCHSVGCEFKHRKLAVLKAHVTRAHGVKDRVCSICPFKCHSKNGMSNHMKCVHVVSSSTEADNNEMARDDTIEPEETDVGGFENLELNLSAGPLVGNAGVMKSIAEMEETVVLKNFDLNENADAEENNTVLTDVTGGMGSTEVEVNFENIVTAKTLKLGRFDVGDLEKDETLGDYVLLNIQDMNIEADTAVERVIDFDNM